MQATGEREGDGVGRRRWEKRKTPEMQATGLRDAGDGAGAPTEMQVKYFFLCLLFPASISLHPLVFKGEPKVKIHERKTAHS